MPRRAQGRKGWIRIIRYIFPHHRVGNLAYINLWVPLLSPSPAREPPIFPAPTALAPSLGRIAFAHGSTSFLHPAEPFLRLSEDRFLMKPNLPHSTPCGRTPFPLRNGNPGGNPVRVLRALREDRISFSPGTSCPALRARPRDPGEQPSCQEGSPTREGEGVCGNLRIPTEEPGGARGGKAHPPVACRPEFNRRVGRVRYFTGPTPCERAYRTSPAFVGMPSFFLSFARCDSTVRALTES